MKKTATLITGYLGSGKTTLLNEFLKTEKNNQIINCFSCIDGRINFGFCSK
ncbi:GTP-binding protein [Treponema sp.]|uniref:GTP-binding protein n=1 Tax=Treponema sp. TaxID=166 RepID=UPI0039A1FCCB